MSDQDTRQLAPETPDAALDPAEKTGVAQIGSTDSELPVAEVVDETFRFDVRYDGGSVMGIDHLVQPGTGIPVGLGNQDSYGWRTSTYGSIAIVCDGCGSMMDSASGSKLAVRWFQNIAELLLADPALRADPRALVAEIEKVLLAVIKETAEGLTRPGGNIELALETTFLFTIVAAIVTNDWTVIFGAGDGIYELNGKTRVLEPAAGNKPAYLAYKLWGAQLPDFSEEELGLKIHELLLTETVSTILIGSDGLEPLLSSANRTFPGTNGKPLGDLGQFSSGVARQRTVEDRFVASFLDRANRVYRELRVVDDKTTKLPRSVSMNARVELFEQLGSFDDDTTLVVMKIAPRTKRAVPSSTATAAPIVTLAPAEAIPASPAAAKPAAAIPASPVSRGWFRQLLDWILRRKPAATKTKPADPKDGSQKPS